MDDPGRHENAVQVSDVYSVLNNVDSAIIITDAKGEILFLNAQAKNLAELTGRPLLPGTAIFSVVPGSYVEMAHLYLENLSMGKNSQAIEVTIPVKEAKEIHLEIKGLVILETNDPAARIVIEVRDITPRKIFERKIIAIANELNSLIEHANAVIIGIDARGYITDWNAMASQITGYTKNESYTQKVINLLLDEKCQDSFYQAMQEVLLGKIITNYEVSVRSKSGKLLTFLIAATPRKNGSGSVTGILLIGQDITELSTYRKSLENKVDEQTAALKISLQKEKELVDIRNRFVSIASHEFRSPIASINRNIQYITSRVKSLAEDELFSRLKEIQDHAANMSELLEDVLTIGKNQAGKIEPNMGIVVLDKFFRKIMDEVEMNHNNTHKVEYLIDDPSLVLESDEKLLRNIFINLLNNAVKFSPGQPKIWLTVSHDDGVIKIKIRDNGIGIPESDLERIFNPFTRAANALAIKGTGLGLSIVKKAVETLNGSLHVKSKAGEGTEFTVKLNPDQDHGTESNLTKN